MMPKVANTWSEPSAKWIYSTLNLKDQQISETLGGSCKLSLWDFHDPLYWEF
jgi:hypothetical protein